jgi:glycosyltransferase involved in cell wall biosynthesis
MFTPSTPRGTVSSKPLVSVVITTRNRARIVRDAIESVLTARAQQKAFDIELIVVDDGSTDETPQVVAEYPVRSFRTQGIGMAGARNLGLREATGDYFMLLDDDDVWLPNNGAPQLAMFEQHPEIGLVHAQCLLTDPNLRVFGEPCPPGAYTSGWIFEDLLTYWPQVGTIMTRMEVAREAGDFDPSLTGDNDWDWLLRVAARHQVGRVREPVLLFRQRDGAEEKLAWRRFPATPIIFHRHTRPLGWWKALKLRPILWRHRGWWATIYFLTFMRMNLENGEYQRALRCLGYALHCSVPHTLYNLPRYWARRRDQSMTSQAISK